MMKTLVEFCRNNTVLYSEEIIIKIEEDTSFEVMVNNCLGFCEQCRVTPFAAVEGEYVEAETQEQLLDTIKKKAKEKQEAQKALEDIIEKLEESE